jgi:membrane protein DedA with SNARE-associated domain
LRRDDIDRGFRWFERHGRAVVFFGRLIPLVRSVVSLPAGADRMPLRTFVPYTLAGSLLWNTVWIAIGRALGENWRKAERWGEVIELTAIVLLVVVLVVLVVRSRRARRRTTP